MREQNVDYAYPPTPASLSTILATSDDQITMDEIIERITMDVSELPTASISGFGPHRTLDGVFDSVTSAEDDSDNGIKSGNNKIKKKKKEN